LQLSNEHDPFCYFAVLHEIKNDVSGDVILAGVFDGHAGTAASESVSKVLPSLFREELLTSNGQCDSVMKESLQRSWRRTCDLYRNGCDENGECVVDYDPVEGTLYAETGSIDLIGECYLSDYLYCVGVSLHITDFHASAANHLFLHFSSWDHRNNRGNLNES